MAYVTGYKFIQNCRILIEGHEFKLPYVKPGRRCGYNIKIDLKELRYV